MQAVSKPSFVTLLLLISFASVNAALITPALPAIAHFFNITHSAAQQTITWFLIGYAFGQLLYGPLANRFGRKPALYIGISLQIVSSLVCLLAGMIHVYWLLVAGRLFIALGASVGLKMTFTLVNEYYEPKMASQKISYLMSAFAITPGLGVALGGILNTHFGWLSCLYAGIVYGLVLFFLVTRLPETQKVLDFDALKVKHLIQGYTSQLKNTQLIIGGLLMAGATSFVYAFAAVAPFVAINLLSMNSTEYGVANILPTMGLLLGSLFSAQFVKKYSHRLGILLGIVIALCATLLMLLAVIMHQSAYFILFLPMTLSYFGLALVFSYASTIAMSHATDKAHGSAVMNFISMGSMAAIVLSLGLFSITKFLLPMGYIIICIAMFGLFKFFFRKDAFC